MRLRNSNRPELPSQVEYFFKLNWASVSKAKGSKPKSCRKRSSDPDSQTGEVW
jgi:hypothetical protein